MPFTVGKWGLPNQNLTQREGWRKEKENLCRKDREIPGVMRNVKTKILKAFVLHLKH